MLSHPFLHVTARAVDTAVVGEYRRALFVLLAKPQHHHTRNRQKSDHRADADDPLARAFGVLILAARLFHIHSPLPLVVTVCAISLKSCALFVKFFENFR